MVQRRENERRTKDKKNHRSVGVWFEKQKGKVQEEKKIGVNVDELRCF